MVDVAQLSPAWMPPELIQAWYGEYLDLGGADVPGSAAGAAQIIRQDTKYRGVYDSYFPGSRRDDGSLRLTEAQYSARISSYEDALLGVDVNPDVFADKFGGLISGDVSEGEFTRRVESMYERVIEAAPGIRDFYAENYGIDMTDSGIVASFLDPDVGQAVLDRTIAVSEIGGEASSRGFKIGVDYAESLVKAGVSQDQAQDLFGTAAMDIPTLDALARRHADPDDTFDLNEFTQASIFDDPTQRRRVRRLIATERATFSGTGYQEDRQTGGITGLAQR